MPAETSMGGPRADFPTTLWSTILAARDAGQPDLARTHLDRLFRAYWKPIYACLRLFWQAPPEDAKDSTQDFFASLLARDALASVDPSKGTFRSFLKACLRNFMLDQRRHDGAAKRSADLRSLDAAPAELERLTSDARRDTPDATFDRAWTLCLLQRAFDAVAAELDSQGRRREWDVFTAHDLESSDDDYAPLAARFAMTEREVKTALPNVRRRVRAALKTLIDEYAASSGDADHELRELFPS